MQTELVARARGGDHEAFARLVDGSVDRLYALANVILRDSDRAQDAVQEALVSAWKDLRTLRDPEAWDAWTYRLTVWSCYRQARRERRRGAVELQAVAEERLDLASDVAMWVVERDRLEHALGRLPVDQRAVIVAHCYLGSPISEVAEMLGIPAGTVKSRLNRGLTAIRSVLDAEPEATPRVVPVRTP